MPDAPLIYDVQTVSVSENSAAVVWKTHGSSDSRVEYGVTTAYGMNASDGSLTESHVVAFSGLTPDTLYHYRVGSTSSWNLSAVSGNYVFRTSYVYVGNATTMVANQTTTVEVPKENISMDIMTGENVTNATITVKTSSSSQVNATLSVPALNKYIEVETSSDVRDAIKSVMLKVYYTDAELNASGLNESSLAIYWYNTTSLEWVKLSTTIPWVYGTGVNTTANYVWANVSHFSDYAVGGEALSCTMTGDDPPCGQVSLQEVINLIILWSQDKANLNQVVTLINAWAQAT